jgi:PleD family two-component response regulator
MLHSRLRSSDLLARFGGDEFAVLRAEADSLRARKVAEVVLESLASTGTEPLIAADTALYNAKRAGRDRFTVYDPVMDRVQGPVA